MKTLIVSSSELCFWPSKVGKHIRYMITLGPGSNFLEQFVNSYVKQGAGMTKDDTHRKLLPDDTWK